MMGGFVTNSTLSKTEGIGSQCHEYFCLMCIAAAAGKTCVLTPGHFSGQYGNLLGEFFDNPIPILKSRVAFEHGDMDSAPAGLVPGISYDFTMNHKPMSKFVKSESDLRAIRNAFKFNPGALSVVREFVAVCRSCFGVPLVAVHFRDYLGRPPHLQFGQEYYDSAIVELVNRIGKCALIMFSNHTDHLKQMRLSERHNLPGTYVSEPDCLEMPLMYCCDHSITGNSTFSVIPALLRGSGCVVCPKNWIDDGYDQRHAPANRVNGRWWFKDWVAL